MQFHTINIEKIKADKFAIFQQLSNKKQLIREIYCLSLSAGCSEEKQRKLSSTRHMIAMSWAEGLIKDKNNDIIGFVFTIQRKTVKLKVSEIGEGVWY
jgi:hypothetical protein